MALLINFIIFFMEFTYIYIFMNVLTGKCIHDTLRKMVVFSVPGIFLMSILLFFIENAILAVLCLLLFYLILLVLVFQIHLTDLILLFALEYIILGIFQLVIYTLLYFCSFFIQGDIIPIIGNLILILLCSLFCHVISLSFLYDHIQTWNRYIKLVVINCFLIVFSLFIIVRTDYLIQENLLILFLLIILLAGINIDSIFLNQQYKLQKQELETYKTYVPIIEKLIDDIQIHQHDFNNHLQAIEMLPLTHPDYASLSEALVTYKNHLTPDPQYFHLLKINYHCVAGFLINKCTQSVRQQKNLNIKVERYCLVTQVPEYVLIEMLGILTDNALDACPEQGNIDLLLDTDREKICVAITNDVEKIPDGFPGSFFQKGYTTKTSHPHAHGIGLYKLKKLTDSFHGSILVTAEEKNHSKRIQIELIV